MSCTSQIFWYEQITGPLGAIHPLFIAPLAALEILPNGTPAEEMPTRTAAGNDHLHGWITGRGKVDEMDVDSLVNGVSS